MIKNLELIKNPDLRRDLLILKENVIDILSKSVWDYEGNTQTITDFLYRNVMGVGYPISICDGGCWMDHINYNYFY